jgi:hypothetical protein
MAAGQYGRNNLGNYLKKLGQVELDEGQIAWWNGKRLIITSVALGEKVGHGHFFILLLNLKATIFYRTMDIASTF